MKLRFRKFKPTDAKRCSQIAMKNFKEKMLVDSGGYMTKELEGPWTKYLKPLNLIWMSIKPKSYLRVIEDEDGKVVGIGRYTLDKYHAEVGLMFVDGELQGKGVGKALLEHILNEINKRKIGYVDLYSILFSAGFYSMFGFAHLHDLDEIREGIVDKGGKSRDLIDKDAAEKFRVPSLGEPVGARYAYYMYRILE